MDNSILDNMRIDTFQDLRNRKRNDRKVYVPLNELHTFKNHPFKIIDDERMMELAENVKRNGVYVPGTVRPLDTGGYEIISGHRRKRACELAGLEKMPVYIKELDDDAAIIEMIDSNIQRDEILPSEKAFAFKMKLEAIIHQGKLVVSENKDDIDENENRGTEESEDSTSRQVVGKLESADIVGQDYGESGRQVQRYIRLTELKQELLDFVDNRKIKVNPAVELSYLTEKQQKILLSVIKDTNAYPSLAQAQQLKKLSQDGAYTKESVYATLSIMTGKERKVVLKESFITKFFKSDTSNEDIEKIICMLLEKWQKNGGRV